MGEETVVTHEEFLRLFKNETNKIKGKAARRHF